MYTTVCRYILSPLYDLSGSFDLGLNDTMKAVYAYLLVLAH